MRFDLAVIAFLQVAAMAYGLHTVWLSRPVYLVATDDRFRLTFANEFADDDLAHASADYRSLPWGSFRTVAAVMPKDKREQQELMFQAMQGGKDIYFLPKYYSGYQHIAGQLVARSIPARDFASELPEQSASVINDAIENSHVPAERLRAVPITSARGDATMLVDARDGRPVAPVAVDPWPVLEALARRHSAP